MLERIFADSARGVAPLFGQFEAEARRCGARSIEAEHMLLALATRSDTGAGRVLIGAGLDHDRLVCALVDERRRTLAIAGLRPLEHMPAATAADGSVSLGTSAKAALRRALHASREARPRRARLDGTDLLIGILGAELGTVPRALAIAGIDRCALIARARAGTGETERPC
jgi:hypothetical protein